MAALIGALRATLSADTSKFESGMKRARGETDRTAGYIRSRFGNIGASIKSGLAGLVAGIGVGLFASAIKSGLEYAGSLGEVAQQLGLTTRQLQIYRFAAGQVGIGQEEMDKGLSKLNISLGKAKLGAKAPAQAFGVLSKIIGVDIVAASKQGGDALPLVADALAQIADRSKRAAIETIIFSKIGSKYDTLLTGGSRALNEFAQAADKLGIVLSDEQIQNADETADKLEAMQTVLKAKIAGVVADNAEAILDLANAMGKIAAVTFQAGAGVASFASMIGKNVPLIIASIERVMPVLGLFLRGMAMFAQASGGPGRSATAKLNEGGTALAEAKRRGLKIASGGGVDVPDFLAGGGGKGKHGPKGKSADQLAEEAQRKRIDALNDAYRFAEDTARAERDVLAATRDLSTDYVERNSISVQILDAERAARVAELNYEVELNKLSKGAQGLTKAQADIQLSLYDQKDALERQKIVADEAAETAENAARYQELVLDLDRRVLESRSDLAETASERRAIELELLDFAYRQRKAALDAAIAQEKDAAALQRLTLERDRLMDTYANDKAGVLQSTRGPMEDWMAGLPTTAAKAQEAFERLQVEGFDGLIDAAMELRNGFDSAGKSLLQVLENFLLGLVKMQLQQSLASIIPAGGFKLPKFATGGSIMVGGRAGTDRNVLSMNGLPIARVSRGEMLNITPQGGYSRGGAGGVTQIFNFPNSDHDSFRRNERQMSTMARRRLALG